MKSEDIKGLSIEELVSKKSELMDKYTRLKLNHKMSQIENPLELRNLRRSIARVNTFISQKN